MVVTAGVWGAAVTVTVRVAAALVCEPSLSAKETVRVEPSGSIAVLVYVTARSAARHWASVACDGEVRTSIPMPGTNVPAMSPIVEPSLTKPRTSCRGGGCR